MTLRGTIDSCISGRRGEGPGLGLDRLDGDGVMLRLLDIGRQQLEVRRILGGDHPGAVRQLRPADSDAGLGQSRQAQLDLARALAGVHRQVERNGLLLDAFDIGDAQPGRMEPLLGRLAHRRLRLGRLLGWLGLRRRGPSPRRQPAPPAKAAVPRPVAAYARPASSLFASGSAPVGPSTFELPGSAWPRPRPGCHSPRRAAVRCPPRRRRRLGRCRLETGLGRHGRLLHPRLR